MRAEPIRTERFDLEPLRVDHAEEMARLLDDEALHRFIGGRPDSLVELRARYARQVGGRSPDGKELWLNWVIRDRVSARPIGTVQAAVRDDPAGTLADVAWVVGTQSQGQGVARESATAMVSWLRQQGVDGVAAYIHPEHNASMAVARAIGLTPTDRVVEGEVEWRSG
ncbi:MAG: GNAT family N-acetyltransferase [Candidatus Nanopelagicales bacterium]